MFNNTVEQFSSTSFNVQSHSKSHFSYVQMELHVFVFIASCPVNGHHGKEPGFVFYAPSHQLFKKHPYAFSTINTLSSLSLLSYVRCYSAFNNLCHSLDSLDQVSSNFPIVITQILTFAFCFLYQFKFMNSDFTYAFSCKCTVLLFKTRNG